MDYTLQDEIIHFLQLLSFHAYPGTKLFMDEHIRE